MTDAELIEATQRGERDAFGVLVERYQRMVEAVAFGATGRHALVDDVVQDTFVAAWNQLGRLRDASRVRPWLYGIARNLACKARRGRRPELPVDELVSTTTPFEEISRVDLERRVAAALARLPGRYREPIVLFYYEHCSVQEVASALGLREDAAMQRLSRGRKKLGEALAGDVEVALENKPSRRGLAACVLGLVTLRAVPAATAAPASTAGHAGAGSSVAGRATGSFAGRAASNVLAWLATHWRVPGLIGATAVGATIVIVASTTEVKQRRVEPEPEASNDVAFVAPRRAPPTLPSKRPSELPEMPRAEAMLHRSVSLAWRDPRWACSAGARGLVVQALGGSSFRHDGANTYFEPSPALQRTLDKAGEHAAAHCGGDQWPELYVMCEGTLAEIREGNVTCYPYDIFERG